MKCQICNGRGKLWVSCCGDNMYPHEDAMVCPTCHEHTGDEQDSAETCEECSGTGEVYYIPFGYEWRQEMKKLTKDQLINLLRNALTKIQAGEMQTGTAHVTPSNLNG